MQAAFCLDALERGARTVTAGAPEYWDSTACPKKADIVDPVFAVGNLGSDSVNCDRRRGGYATKVIPHSGPESQVRSIGRYQNLMWRSKQRLRAQSKTSPGANAQPFPCSNYGDMSYFTTVAAQNPIFFGKELMQGSAYRVLCTQRMGGKKTLTALPRFPL